MGKHRRIPSGRPAVSTRVARLAAALICGVLACGSEGGPESGLPDDDLMGEDDCSCPAGQLCVVRIDGTGGEVSRGCVEAPGCDPEACSTACEDICDSGCTDDDCRDFSSCFDCEFGPGTLGRCMP